MMGFRFAPTHPTAQFIPHDRSCVGWVEAEAKTHRFNPATADLSPDGVYKLRPQCFPTVCILRFARTHPTALANHLPLFQICYLDSRLESFANASKNSVD